jgi:outer membrane lipoprotein-sorting protein
MSPERVVQKLLFIFTALLCSGEALFAADFHRMLEKTDNLVTFPDNDFSAEYTIVEDAPGEGRTTTIAVIFRRDAEEKYVIVILKPEINKGQGYLKLGETLWFYDPDSRRFNSTSSKERFQNTNARNSDFTRSTLAEDYNVLQGERVKLGRFDCWLLHLQANNDEVTYPIMKIWISDDGLLRKTEDYSLSNQLLRTTAIPSYQLVGDKFVPNKILFIEELEGTVINGEFIHSKTQITITKPSLQDLPNSVYSKKFLEDISR